MARTRTRATVAPTSPASARQLACDVLVAWRKRKGPLDELLSQTLRRSNAEERDRALVAELVLGVVRNLSRLEYYLSRLRPQGDLEPALHFLVLLGFYQLLETRIPPHAAVHETVALAPKRGRGVVNGILRSFQRDSQQITNEVLPPPLRYSHPEFLWQRWTAAFGEEAAAELCRWNNRPAPLTARVNTLRTDRERFLRDHPDAVPMEHPLMVRLPALPRAALANGECYMQDPSTLIACEMLDPQPGQRVLDACASPGGKTLYLAALMKNQGVVVAADRPARLERLHENVQAAGADCVEIVAIDWEGGNQGKLEGNFDAILADVPCSNTGVLRRRVDARWRLSSADFPTMRRRQQAIVTRLLPLLKPGGRLVYSTCSLEFEENQQGVVVHLRDEAWKIQAERLTLPWVDGSDGGYAGLLRKPA